MQGADLSKAKLQGSDLSEAQLQGADLSEAQMQGADLSKAQLQGADLNEAQLQGADLSEAQLQGAYLGEAQLQGAYLREAQLQGADLSEAQMQGADLSKAQLQGAELDSAELANAEFMTTFVFRTADANVSTSAIFSVLADKVKPKPLNLVQEISQAVALAMNVTKSRHSEPVERLLPADVDKWKAAATEFATEINFFCRQELNQTDAASSDKCWRKKRTDKAHIARRFDRLNPNFHTDRADKTDQANWTQSERQSVAHDPEGANYRRRLAPMLGDLACGADGSPYVAREVTSLLVALLRSATNWKV